MKQMRNILLLTSLLMAGCAADETPGVETVIPPVEANIPLIIESATLSGDIHTRATTAVKSGSIGVFLAGQVGGYVVKQNYPYDYGTPAWIPGSKGAIYLGGADATIAAYHPYYDGYSSMGCKLVLASRLYEERFDVSFASGRVVNGTSGKKTISFAMTRAYARLKIVLKRENYPGDCKVSRLELHNLLPSTYLDLENGDYKDTEGQNAATVRLGSNVTVDTSGTTDWGDILLLPCNAPYGGNTKIILTVDDKTMTTLIPTASYTPKKGEYKSITLNIKGTELKATTVTTEDWPTAVDGGTYVPAP